MRVLKITVVLTLALSLVLGATLPVLAISDVAAPQVSDFPGNSEPSAWGKILPRILRGEVVSIDDGEEFFVIQSGEQEHTISVGEGTKYFIISAPRRAIALAQSRVAPMAVENQELAPNLSPLGEGKGIIKRQIKLRQFRDQEGVGFGERPRLTRVENEGLVSPPTSGESRGILKRLQGILQQLRPFGEKATFNDIEVGDTVGVWMVPGEDKPTAKLVLIIKPADIGRIAGTITGVSDDSITIDPLNGDDEVTLEYNENTLFILKGIISVETGQFAHAVYNTETMVAKLVRVRTEAPELTE